MDWRAKNGLTRRLWTTLALIGLVGLIMAGCTGQGSAADGLQPDASAAEDSGGDRADARPEDAGGDGSHDPDTGASDADSSSEADADSDADASLPPCQPRERTAIGTASGSDSWRYGGGHGYPDLVDPDPRCMTVVSDKPELVDALATAQPGAVIYVDDAARIDLTGESLCIPGDVWLVSGRGRAQSPGALLYTTETVKRPILKACGDDVRVSGLRLVGAEPSECPSVYPDNCTGEDRTGGRNCRDCTPPSIGIQIKGYDRLEVDNSEIAGFSYAGVWLSDSVDNHIHHADIHHTQRQGLGYGVVLTRGGDEVVTALIEWNRFDYYRHAVAGSGEPDQDYQARNNLVLENAIGHVFDMHGHDENTDNGSEWAGGEILIHDNTVLADDQYALVVRGKPQHGSWLYDNCLARTSASQAANQRNFFGHFYIDESPSGAAPNQYGRSAAQCQTVRWCYWPSGDGPLRYGASSSVQAGSLGFGDFDGDGKTDAFRANGSDWKWSSGASSRWQTLNTSSLTLDELAFGDFDGDGRTDVMRATGAQWRVSDGGSGSWRTLRSAGETLDELGFGDFDGDGKTDVFRTTGSKWQWSSGGTAAWADLNASTHTIDQLGFGDFDGDGKTDVFSANGSEWRYSSGGTSSWQQLNTSGAGLAGLRFGDFDGDGKTDVFRTSSDRWLVSHGATSSWQLLRIDSKPADQLGFGDFDGDGTTDVFAGGCL